MCYQGFLGFEIELLFVTSCQKYVKEIAGRKLLVDLSRRPRTIGNGSNLSTYKNLSCFLFLGYLSNAFVYRTT